MLPPRCRTDTKCGEISRHGERGEVSADSLTFPFLQGLVSSHPLFLSGEFLVLLFRDKSTKKRLCRGETSHGICSWYAILYCRLTNHFLFIFTRENEPKPTALQKLPLRSDFCEPRRLPHPKPTFYVTQTTIPKPSLSSAQGR